MQVGWNVTDVAVDAAQQQTVRSLPSSSSCHGNWVCFVCLGGCRRCMALPGLTWRAFVCRILQIDPRPGQLVQRGSRGPDGREASRPKKRAVSWRKLTSGGQHNQTPDAPDLGSGPSEISGGSGSVATSQTRTQHRGGGLWPSSQRETPRL